MSQTRASETIVAGEDGAATLQCPVCGENSLHRSGVEVFDRHSADALRGIHVSIDGAEVEIDEWTSVEAGNPSKRRDGVRLRFQCDRCHGGGAEEDFELVIFHDDGEESVRWELPDAGD